ncbi:DUF523 domain-containing protein [Mesosutterella sp. OilRF-GAM-744-9]|uniref:DUF523 domain-containing protein n=1 Tax=Mesosutterella porci TaxID=2915351 RepID=A0ABS9MNN5_9BURK|nr:DUF523 domain-containing protein [Mesosutterella sp. oilRF-744-WT-GAM-9]MCG5030226.1 DUF523 domain-containing protein [Mesosutterella sp. oilRF-744-WT-GAM-9]MCI6529991.1 DUF523 domain-containing protein [Mesosutterella sp.]
MNPVIFVSPCLLGQKVRWDGRSSLGDALFSRFIASGGSIVSLCPECAGGLPTPRAPCEIAAASGGAVLAGRAIVQDANGGDKTHQYLEGARAALALCLANRVRIAVLKDRSPACGVNFIHDGAFSGRVVRGEGVAAALLRRSGILVFDETQLVEAFEAAFADQPGASSCGCGVAG